MSSSMNERVQQAAKIIKQPELYKICEGCESIVEESVTICPNCFGYRFDPEPQAVIDQAVLLGSRERRSVVAEDLQ